MARKATRPKRDNPEQSERFIKAAKEAEANEDPKAMDKAFGRVVKAATPDRRHPKS